MRTLSLLITLWSFGWVGLPFALADTFEGTVKSQILSRGRTAGVTTYFKGARVRAEVAVSGTEWLTLLIDTQSRSLMVTDHLKHESREFPFDKWMATSGKNPRRRHGPLVKTGLRSTVAGYPVEQYVHSHEDGTEGVSWVTSQLPLSPLALWTIHELCSGQPSDEESPELLRKGLVQMKIVRRAADESTIFQNEVTEVIPQTLSNDLFIVLRLR